MLGSFNSVRLLVLALVLAACGGSDRGSLPAAHESASSANRFGPDALVMRVPRTGGTVRVTAYPKLDSVLWTSSDAAPALDHVLAFDPDAGTIAFVDGRGLPGRIDLRMGTVALATTPKAKLIGLASIDGSTIYGFGADGALARFTPSGSWTFKPPRPAHAVFPQRDGAVVILAGRGSSAVVWRLHPPDTKILDTADVPPAGRTLRTQLGDRVYLVSDRTLIGLRTRNLQRVPSIEFDDPVLALTATPSGDRLFVITESSHKLYVVDRYRDKVSGSIELPAQPEDVRMDPLGRYLLVRAAGVDSAWVVDLGSVHLVGAVRSAWRRDLPFVLADGAIAAAQDDDVVIVDGANLVSRTRIRGGAEDFWYGLLWDGFRPRPKSLDQPATFQSDSIDSVRAVAERDSIARADSTAHAATGAPAPAAAPGQPRPIAPAAPRDTATAHGFIVQFGALLEEPAARQLAAQLKARVTSASRDGTTIYRVVLGPYPTREAADAVGKQAGHSYWVYEARP